jgi:hypothetical protein
MFPYLFAFPSSSASIIGGQFYNQPQISCVDWITNSVKIV